MPSLIYNSCLLDAFRGQINFESDGFMVMLLAEDYLPDKAHSRRSDLTGFEVHGSGYREGGQRASVAIDLSEGDAIDIVLEGSRWLNATIAARYAAYYRNAGAAEDDELVALIEFERLVTATNGTFALSESTLRIQN